MFVFRNQWKHTAHKWEHANVCKKLNATQKRILRTIFVQGPGSLVCKVWTQKVLSSHCMFGPLNMALTFSSVSCLNTSMSPTKS